MLPSWPISLRESFDTTNPWVVRLTGFGRERVRPTDLRVVMAIAVVLFLGLGVAGLFARTENMLLLVGGLAYALLVALAFLAPAFGARTRQRIDNDPRLHECLATPLPDRAYVAAMHGRIVTLALLGAVVAAIAGCCVILLIFRSMDELGFRSHPALILTTGLLTVLVGSASYASGILLHASLLASICQLAPGTRLHGGILTAVILIVMALLFVGWLLVWLLAFGIQVGGFNAAFILPLLFDVGLCAMRMASARQTWNLILANAMNETRQHLGLG